MRCLSCNTQLSDYEATIKYADTQKYVDLCSKCLSTISDLPIQVRPDLAHEEIVEEEWEEE